MKCGLRLALSLSLLLTVLLLLLIRHIQDIFEQYSAAAFLADSLSSHRQHGIGRPPRFPGDKIIVMAKLEEEHTNWVQEELPEYVIHIS